MKVLEPGHNYELDILDSYKDSVPELLNFVNRNNGKNSAGTNNQEVLRVLIDRVKFMEEQKHWSGNEKILDYLRMALVLHESRHLERMVEKDQLLPEELPTNKHNGHFMLRHE